MSYREEFLQKYFFRKLQMILNIFHIHNIGSKSVVFELQVIEIAHENTILAKTRTKIATSGFTEMTVVNIQKLAVLGGLLVFKLRLYKRALDS